MTSSASPQTPCKHERSPLRIGVHPANLHLTLAAAWDMQFDSLDVEFVRYDGGSQSADVLSLGQIDVCGTSSPQPLFAAAKGLDVILLAASAPRRLDGSIVVRADSPVWSLQDLVGRKIGLAQKSFQIYLLVQALEKAGLNLDDITICDVMPGAGLAVLQQGSIDALVTLAPYQDYAMTIGNMRLLEGSEALIPNRSIFWTLGERQLSAYARASFFDGLERLGREVPQDVARASYILAADAAGSVLRKSWQRAILARDWSIHHINTTILRELQDEADILFRHGVLERSIDLME